MRASKLALAGYAAAIGTMLAAGSSPLIFASLITVLALLAVLVAVAFSRTDAPARRICMLIKAVRRDARTPHE